MCHEVKFDHIRDNTCPRLTNTGFITLRSEIGTFNIRTAGSISCLIHDHAHLFMDVPGPTDLVYHDVEVGDATPVKQHPYRINPAKLEHVNKEV